MAIVRHLINREYSHFSGSWTARHGDAKIFHMDVLGRCVSLTDINHILWFRCVVANLDVEPHRIQAVRANYSRGQISR